MTNEDTPVVRVSLNVPALNRLLGGDSEMEVRLRHQVVQQFAEHHLKPLLKSDEAQRVLAAVQACAVGEVQRQVGSLVGGWPHGKSEIQFTPEFKKRFDEAVRKAVDDEIARVDLPGKIREYVDSREDYWKQYAERQTLRVLNGEIERRIKEGIAERLARASANG